MKPTPEGSPPLRSSITQPSTRRARHVVAGTLSEVFGPSVLVTALLIQAGAIDGSVRAGLIACVFATVIPTIGLVLLTRTGRVTDRNVMVRTQRFAIFAGVIASVVIGIAVLTGIGAPKGLLAMLIAMISGLALASVLNLILKLSMHLAIATFFVACQIAFLHAPGLAFVPVLPALAWARVELRAHTWVQVIVGSCAGLAIVTGYLVFRPI